MRDHRKFKRKYGFLLLETLIAMAILGMIVVMIFPTLNFMLRRSKASGFDTQASLLLQEGMEIAYNVIQSNWSVYPTNAVYHPSLSLVANAWQLAPNSDMVEGKYTRSIELLSVCRSTSDPHYTTGACVAPRTPDSSSLVIRTTISWEENMNTKEIHGELLLTSYVSY